MRILMVTNTYVPARNGVAAWTDLSVRELRARGHEVEVLTYRHAAREAGVSGLHEVPGWIGADRDFLVSVRPPRVPDSLSGTEWDVVHVHHPILLGETGVRLARERGAKVCFTCHSVYSGYFDAYYLGLGRLLRPWFDARVARFADRCDVVLAPSARAERWLRDAGAAVRIVRVEPPADTGRVRRLERAAARCELGLDERPVALYVGRIAPEKRVEALVEEFAGALRAMPEHATLALAGGGPHLARVQALVTRRGLTDRVRVLGPVDADRLGAWYSAADVCASASRSETGPLTVVEAMSCGCPAIGLRVPGFEDRIEDGLGGLLAVDEPGALGSAIARVLSDPALRLRLSVGALERAKVFTPAAVTEAALAVYESLLD